MDADLIVTSGKVVTMDPKRRVVEAFAVRDGVIVATGTNGEVERAAGPGTRRLDAGGKTITPGLIDTHIHVVSLGSIGAGAGLGFVGTGQVLDVSKAKSVEDIVGLIGERVRESQKGEWIITGWPAALGLENKPSRWDLDAVSPENPVMISGYPYAIVNSYLLREAGIDRDTESPPGGEIEKDAATGEPTGALAFQAVYQLLPSPPQPSVAETEAAIKQVHEAFLREGLTTYKDVGLRDNAIKAYRNLRMRDELQCRTQMMYTWQWTLEDALRTAERFTPYGDDMLMLRSVKLSLDGGIPSRTAWSYDDWNIRYSEVAEGSRGYWKIPPEELDKIVEVLHRAGLQVCCHCEGDRAIDTYLDAIEKALQKEPRQNCRHTVIHCNLPTGRAIERMRNLGDNIAIESQSPWLADAKWAGACGPERSKRFMPFKTWLQSGITVGNGCDFPPEPFPPRLGLWSACTRQVEPETYGSHPYGTDECLSVEEALYTYTLGGAKCLHWDDKIGSLEPGKYADFVVWEEDLLSVDPGQLKDATVSLTAVGGRVLYEQAASRDEAPVHGAR